MAKSYSIVKKKVNNPFPDMEAQKKQVDETGHIQYGYAAPSVLERKPKEQPQPQKDSVMSSILNEVTKNTLGDRSLVPASVVVPKSPNAQADYEDARRRLWAYQNDQEAQKAVKEKERAYNQAMSEGATGTGATYQDETLARLQRDVKDTQQRYESEKAAAHDRNIYDKDMEEIAAMNDEQRSQLAAYAAARDQGTTGNPITDLFYLPAKKKKAAGSLLDALGEDRLNELAETYSRSIAQQEKEQVQRAAEQASTGALGGTLTTVGGIVASPVSSWMGIKGRLDELGNASGRYKSLQPFTPGDAMNVFTDTARQNVTQQIAGDGSNPLRQGAAILYQAGVGVADSTARAIVLGPAAAAATSAMGSYARTLSDASEKGATASQAVLLASANAALDYAMDKIPLDRLFSLASSGSTSALKAAFKQAGIEISTEGASFLGSQILEMEILQGNSEYAQSIQAYMSQGLSQPDATFRANKDLIAQAGQQLLVAGLSGGVSAGVSTAIGNARNRRAQALLDSETDAAPDAAPAEPAPEQPTAQQEAPPVDTAPDSPTDQLLQNPQQLRQESALTPEQIRAAQQEPVARRPVQSQQESASPIDTVSRMAEDIGSNATARQQQTQENLRSVQDQVAALTGKQPETAAQETAQQPFDTTGKQSTPSEDTRKSATFTNSGRRSSDEDIRAGYRETLRQDASAGDYQQKHNADVLSVAQERVSTPEKVIAEYDYIMSKSGPLTAEDGVTGRLVAKQLFKDGDTQRLVQMNKRLAQEASNAGQFNQAFAVTGKMRDVSDPLSAADSATARITGMAQKDSVYPGRKSGMSYEAWQDAVSKKITGLAREVDSVKAGDTAAMKGVITKLAKERGTTAFFGISNRLTKSASSILDKLEFDDLKKIADTQIASMPDDYRKRGKVEIVNGIRKQSMLSSLKTFERNLAGNGAVGLLDSASDSFGGRLADIVLSKVTGKRTIGDDISRAGTYMKSAADAGRFAALCVELNVPIETDVDASFNSAVGANASGKFIGKSFTSASGNPIMRGLYAYQKYMSYALEVSDKIFEGGTAGATEASLRRLKSSGLSDEEISRLSDYTANRRTFKDATWTDEQGRTRGSDLSRTTQSFKNIAKGKGGIVEPVVNAAMDTAIPFASVPMNVTQTGIDYTAGVFKGLSEIVKIAIDAKHGIDIPVERQRQAASDFGRGLTGAGLISLAAAAAAKGIIQVHDDSDKDKKALDQSQGLSGAQINWTALNRAAEGGDETWKSGDLVTSLDFLEPFNTHMYLGVELANAESPMDYVKAPFASILSSFADSPMNDGLNQITELITDSVTAAQSGDMKEMGNAVAEYAGNVASSFIPQFVRQAAQTADGYYRDTRGKDSASYAVNSVKSALPGASETLPKKMDGFGQEQKRGGFVTNFLDPTNTHRLQLDETAQALDELSQNPDVKNIYPERQAPLKVKDASGEDVQLTAEQRETYQKEYGKRVKAYYDGLLKNSNFDKLPDEMKAEALQNAKEYGTQFARAAVTDYKDVPKNSSKTAVVFDVVRDVLKTNATSAVGDLEKAWELGTDTKKATDTLNAVYDTISEMSNTTKASVLKKSGGNTRIYLEARNSGLPSDKTLSIIKAVQSIPEENRDKRPVQLQSVAETKGLSDTQLDTVMKLYMPDYDPKDKESDKTEVKYDYIRRELGLSAKEYADTYYAYLYADADGDGKTKKDDSVQGIIDLGFDEKMAEQLYQIYKGSSNSAKATLKKFIEENY